MAGRRGGAVTSGGAMTQLFGTIPQAANAGHEKGERIRGSRRIFTLVELSLWLAVLVV